MTVEQLIDLLQQYPKDALVIQSNDSEGNHFSPCEEVSLGRYEAENGWSGTFGLAELTKELEEKGYTEEDVVDGPLAVCLWPTY